MKKWIVTVAAAATVATGLFAADQDEAIKARQAQMLQAIQKELGLTDAQTKKWGDIQQSYLEKHMKLQEAQTKEINALLTDDQRKKFEEMQRRFREQLTQRMGGK